MCASLIELPSTDTSTLCAAKCRPSLDNTIVYCIIIIIINIIITV